MSETIEVADELVDRADIKDGTAVVQFSKTEAALAELRKRHEGVQFDLATTAGDKAARSARLELVTLRTDLEKKRKAFKAPVIEMGKIIDEQAKRITGEIVALEAPIDQQIRDDEARREAVRAEKARMEQVRVDAHRAQLLKISDVVIRASGLPSHRVRGAIDAVTAIEIDPSAWEEFADEATRTRSDTLEKLALMLEQVEAKEAEAAKLEAQRIENERVAAEQRAAAERLAAQQREIEEQQRVIEARRLEQEREEAARRSRIDARFVELETRLNYFGRPSLEIDAALLLTKSNAPSEDTFGARLEEAQALQVRVIESLEVELIEARRREADIAAEAAARAAAIAATPAPAAVVPVAAPVAQVRQPQPAPEPEQEEPTLKISDINSAIKPFSIDAAGMAQLGFVGTKRGAATLFKRSDLVKLYSKGSDLLLTAGARVAGEKAA